MPRREITSGRLYPGLGALCCGPQTIQQVAAQIGVRTLRQMAAGNRARDFRRSLFSKFALHAGQRLRMGSRNGANDHEARLAAKEMAREEGQARFARLPFWRDRLLRPRQSPRDEGGRQHRHGAAIRAGRAASMIRRKRRLANGRDGPGRDRHVPSQVRGAVPGHGEGNPGLSPRGGNRLSPWRELLKLPILGGSRPLGWPA